jgi:hypothetical protein
VAVYQYTHRYVPIGTHAERVQRVQEGGIEVCRTTRFTVEDAQLCVRDALYEAVRADGIEVLPKLDKYFDTIPGANCHSKMHWVGAHYAKVLHVTAYTIHQYLPGTFSRNCSGGFAHGVITDVMKTVDTPAEAVNARKVCLLEKERLLIATCAHGLGHAFAYATAGDAPKTLALCKQLGEQQMGECGSAMFHDRWEIDNGLLSPKERPADYPKEAFVACDEVDPIFMGSCWYRRIQGEAARNENKLETDIPQCLNLEPPNNSACLTGLSATRTVNGDKPADVLQSCAGLQQPDFSSCIQGIDLRQSPATNISMCNSVPDSLQPTCVEWFAFALSYSEGRNLGATMCKSVSAASRSSCVRGSARWKQSLPVF